MDAERHHPEAPHTSPEGGVHREINSSNGGPQMAWGGDGDDVIVATPGGNAYEQIHLYGGAGDDTFILNVGLDESRLGVTNMHGHHVFGGEGSDSFVFSGLEDLRGTIVGRIDDLNAGTDQILIGDQELDLTDPGALKGFDAAVVSWNGQQWLDIRNANDGRLLYALEGARLEVQSDGSIKEEVHFPGWSWTIPDALPEVAYVDPMNFLPEALTSAFSKDATTLRSESTDGSKTVGTAGQDRIVGDRGPDTLSGGAGNDYISGDLGNDFIEGGPGDDLIEGGKGQDTLHGGNGNDTIAGGSDDDLIYGGAGDDVLYGGSENDTLYGGLGDDLLYGGPGDDHLDGGLGRDTLYGGPGDDTLVAQSDGDRLLGGAGDDLFLLRGGQDVVANGGVGFDVFRVASEVGATIEDFDAAMDRLFLAEHFKTPEQLQENVRAVANAENPDVADLLIGLPEGGQILLPHLGHFADRPELLDAEWSPVGEAPPLEEPEPEEDDPRPDDQDAHRDQSSADGTCFVATASYGDPFHPDVRYLRALRDQKLRNYAAGRIFIRAYWSIGPRLARHIRADRPSGRAAKAVLHLLVMNLRLIWKPRRTN